MKNSVFVLLSLMFILVGCASQSSVNSPASPCASVPDDKYLECLSKQGPATEPASAVQKTPVDGQPVITETAPTDPATPPPPKPTPPAKKKPQPKPSDTPELPTYDPRPPPKVDPPFPPALQGFTLEYAPGPNGCLPGNNLSARNRSSKWMVEVLGENLRVCGGSSTDPAWTSQRNLDIRPAEITFPDTNGIYYFYPYRDVNGHTVPISDIQEYTVKFYRVVGNAGDSPVFPAKATYVCKWTADLSKFDSNWGGAITINDDTPTMDPLHCKKL